MHELSISKVINAPKSRVWEELKDFGSIYKVHPMIETSPVTNGIPSGNGSERTCVMYNGGEIKEKVFDYHEGEKYSVEVIDPGPFPIETSLVTISVTEISANQTQVSFDMKFLPKYGAIGNAMAKLVMKKQFSSILMGVIDGLQTHIQTGQLVGKKGKLVAA